MDTNVRVREGSDGEAEELTLLARRSKASWGYPEAWLVEWETELEITAEYIRDNTVLVAETDGASIGVIGLGTDPLGPEVQHLWVAPEHQGRGVGRALLDRALEIARQRGWPSLRIVSDPFALPFYVRFGAERIGEVDAPVAGTARTLPLLRLKV